MERVKPYVKCRNCSFEWLTRAQNPIECPNCKVRNPINKNPNIRLGDPNSEVVVPKQHDKPIIKKEKPKFVPPEL